MIMIPGWFSTNGEFSALSTFDKDEYVFSSYWMESIHFEVYWTSCNHLWEHYSRHTISGFGFRGISSFNMSGVTKIMSTTSR